MKQTETRPKVREDWSAMTLYERFEQAAIVVLTGIIMIIIVSALWQLIREVGLRLLLGGLDPLDYRTFQAVFGMIFTVVIALEFKRSLLVAVERRFGVVQARSIILITLLAIVRKFIILDLSETEASKIGALAATVLALGLVYWLVRDQDMRERSEAQDL
ncbi:phosphate-starvation-inducible PsiE family protein [Salipiger sp. PrR003]|uniref:phosphate-starvation-inducible PsiE family protein n=1 Tax=Salipiger sp. PrR003 TaxID=2706776 RepID=UPI00194555D1|nr:phosphate-starvation-inducible PsiE family protein [Salipiger sp. PrR003]